MKLTLVKGHLDTICHHVLAELPSEACGLLVGLVCDNGTVYAVEDIWPATNVLAHQLGRFEIDPMLRLKVEKVCRDNGQKVIGHWHSHPNAPAQPSDTDLALAYEPDLAWLIVSTLSASIAEINAFLPPKPDRLSFSPIDLQIT